MLSELHIQNFAVIEDVHIALTSGLNIISGEEGAGKSLIIDSLYILLGARAPSGIIRSGASTARIEGIFWLPGEIINSLNGILLESAIEPDPDGMLVISREIQQQGRSVARLNSRVVPLSLLRQISRYLVDMHGQTDTISLLDHYRQLELLDSFGNVKELRNLFSATIDKLKDINKKLASLSSGITNGRYDLLHYQVAEIEHAQLIPGEDASLIAERERLLRSESIKESCQNAYNSLYGEERSATVLIHEAQEALRLLTKNEPDISLYREQLLDTMANLEEIARDLREYGESVEDDPSKLDEIEQRISLIQNLKRKYGSTIEDILLFCSDVTKELDSVDSKKEHEDSLKKEIESLKIEAGKQAEELSLSRRKSAELLTGLVNEGLADVGLSWAKFDINLHRREDAEGLPVTGKRNFAHSRTGIDQVEFLIATNPGEPLKSLSTIASGGETCRIMLALKSSLKQADNVPTLVFDEIDAGIGGRSADIVGRKLSILSNQHQVICVTHLPQIACFGDLHIKITKETSSGRSSTKVEAIKGKNRIDEIAAMLGSEDAGELMVDGAEKLFDHAQSWIVEERNKVSA
jgi:DNA repair protein RecN (Recombination protein N)